MRYIPGLSFGVLRKYDFHGRVLSEEGFSASLPASIVPFSCQVLMIDRSPV